MTRHNRAPKGAFVTAIVTTAALVALLLAPAPAAAAGSSGVKQDLKTFRLETALRLAFLEHFKADGMRIDIDVSGGSVTLSGTVEHKATQELAEEVALSVHGVTSVDDNLEVEPPATSQPPVAKAVGKAERETDDAILESRVKLKLIDNLGMKAFKVEVEAVDGTVSLRGTLPSDSLRDTAISTAKSTSGVKKVLDLIKVG